MPLFLDLAPELLDRIVDYVSHLKGWPPYSAHILGSLALTCRTLYQITNPVLYRSFTQREVGFGKLNHLARFLETILERPDLAALVKDLTLLPYLDKDSNWNVVVEEEDADDVGDDGDDEDGADGGKKEEPLNSQHKAFLAALEAVSWWPYKRLETQQWINAIKQYRNTNVICAIILLSLPNVQSLSVIVQKTRNDPPWFLEVLEEGVRHNAKVSSSGTGVPFFANLTKVIYSSDASGFIIPTKKIEVFFHIPSFREFTVMLLRKDPSHKWDPLPKACGIERLNMPACRVYNWEPFLAPMKNLKRLEYSPRHMQASEKFGHHVAEIGRALKPLREMLESLELNDFLFEEPSGENSLLGSLRDFPRLKELVIQLALLIGSQENEEETADLWELLPPSLETLMVGGECKSWSGSYNRDGWIDQVIGVAIRKRSHFPRLEKLVVKWPRPGLVSKCAENGIPYEEMKYELRMDLRGFGG